MSEIVHIIQMSGIVYLQMLTLYFYRCLSYPVVAVYVRQPSHSL